MPKDATLKQSKEKLREIEDGLDKGIHLSVKGLFLGNRLGNKKLRA
jgi:hypothetical protein